MIKEKNSTIRLFENDYTITGKHATYLKYLVKNAKLYNDYIDVYLNAAVMGYLYQRKEEVDTESTDRARIYADAFSHHRTECLFIYRTITLLDEDKIEVEDRINRAFRLDAMPEKEDELKKSIEKFNSYVRGGIEYLFSVYTEGNTSTEDYIRAAYTVASNFKDSIEGVSYEEKIKQLLNK